MTQADADLGRVLAEALTPLQLAAATDPSREVLCLACAGSGKSRTLAYRIARLIVQGAAPSSIVAFTFTEKAAESIKRRVATALGACGIPETVMGAMFIGTIHAYCQHVLGDIDPLYRQFDVLDENRLKLYVISRYPGLGVAPLRQRARGYFDAIKKFTEAWKMMHDELVDIGTVQAEDAPLGRALAALNDSLYDDQFIDFSLMIRHVVVALEASDTRAEGAVAGLGHLMVDEYQDVSPAQDRLISLLHARSETLFVVGDDDQAIYAWRGADVSNILGFCDRHAGASVHTLSENFRSTDAIVSASDGFVSRELGPSRLAKAPVAAWNRAPRQIGVFQFADRVGEADWVASRITDLLGTEYIEPEGRVRGLTAGDFAVLMRSTRQPEADGRPRHAAFTDALGQSEVRFSLEAGGGPFERPQVEVLRSTFELLRDGAPSRDAVRRHFEASVLPAYPLASFDALVRVLTEWGRAIHAPTTTARRRVYPQQLVYDLLSAFGVAGTALPDEVMSDIGLFSRMIQDVEAVYMSVDSPRRFGEILNFLQNAAETGYDVTSDEVGLRPDAVTVSTVHKMKGLEFPVVFIVDAEAQRFPRRRAGYDGWLPATVVASALTRGAYQCTVNEEARLFYTAMTRAERFLYVTCAEHLPLGKQARRMSAFAAGLAHEELETEPTRLPEGLTPARPVRRVDETVLPTSFSDVRYYLRCPMDYRFRQGYGFSPPVPDLFGFGKTVHTAVEKLHAVFVDASPSSDEAAQMAADVFHLKHVPPSRDPENHPGPFERAKAAASAIVRDYADAHSDDFIRRKQVEARFEIPAKDCVITGAIDLLLREDSDGAIREAEVVDFKAIEGGEDVLENEALDWRELSLQVQLYALAARDVLGENARTGSVHLLKDNQRVAVPVDDASTAAAVGNIEWAVEGILSGRYPRRPSAAKCSKCDFCEICPQTIQPLPPLNPPPAIRVPGGSKAAAAFDESGQGRAS
jgi:DNA helicase-2/ATP-dependent DNA helicase PcrA